MNQPSDQFDQEIHDIYQARNIQSSQAVKSIKNYTAWLDDSRGRAIFIIVVALVAVVASLLAVLSLAPISNPPSSVPTPVLNNPSPSVSFDLYDKMRGSAVVFGLVEASQLDKTKMNVTQIYGYGLVISADGWLVTLKNIGLKINKKTAVGIAGKIYYPEILITDPVLPLSYIKIKADGLTVVQFAASPRLEISEPVLVIQNSQSLRPLVYRRALGQINALSYNVLKNPIINSEQIPDRYLLDNNLPSDTLGAPVYNFRGEAVGLISEISPSNLPQILPLNFLPQILPDLFKDQIVKRPNLGLTYQSSDWLWTDANRLSNALVIKVNSTSPAYNILRTGDQIVSVSGEPVGERSLSSMIQPYRIGAKVELSIKRGLEDLKVEVTLGEVIGRAVWGK